MSVFFVQIAVNTDGRLTHVEANADEKSVRRELVD